MGNRFPRVARYPGLEFLNAFGVDYLLLARLASQAVITFETVAKK